MRPLVVAALLALAMLACERSSENAGSTAGPGVDVDCLKRRALALQRLALLPGQGVGNTEVDVQCGPQQ